MPRSAKQPSKQPAKRSSRAKASKQPAPPTAAPPAQHVEPQIVITGPTVEASLIKQARDDSAECVHDLAAEAREDAGGWSSGLAKYAQWRKDFRDCPLDSFQRGRFKDVKGKIPAADKIDDPTGRGWV